MATTGPNARIDRLSDAAARSWLGSLAKQVSRFDQPLGVSHGFSEPDANAFRLMGHELPERSLVGTPGLAWLVQFVIGPDGRRRIGRLDAAAVARRNAKRRPQRGLRLSDVIQ